MSRPAEAIIAHASDDAAVETWPTPARLSNAIYNALPDDWSEKERLAGVGEGLRKFARQAAQHRRPVGYVNALYLASSDAFLHALGQRHAAQPPVVARRVLAVPRRHDRAPRHRRVRSGSRAGPDDPDEADDVDPPGAAA